MKQFLFSLAVAALAIAALSQTNTAQAGVIVYSGFDAGAGQSDPRPNSNAAAAAFDAAVAGFGTSTLIDFENQALGNFTTRSLGSGVSMTASGSNGEVRNTPIGSLSSVWGYNTTAGGSRFVSVGGSSLTFNFVPGVEGFGAYISGIQLQNETITFFDGSTQTVAIPFVSGGIAFVGFTDVGANVASVTLTFGGDVVGIDDVRVVHGGPTAVVPEPASLTLLGLGALGLAGYGVRRRKVTA